MGIYNIAGIKVSMSPRYETLIQQSEPYKTHEKHFDFEIQISDKHIYALQKENPHLSAADCEYILAGGIFYRRCVAYNSFLLHASAIMVDGKAYVFSAPSGTGKSTHTALWLKTFPSATYINDDKPLLQYRNGIMYACGTPFSGKTNLNRNSAAPVEAVCILSRAKETYVQRISAGEALHPLLEQTIRDGFEMACLLSLLEKLVTDVPIYKVFCTLESDAALKVWQGIHNREDD